MVVDAVVVALAEAVAAVMMVAVAMVAVAMVAVAMAMVAAHLGTRGQLDGALGRELGEPEFHVGGLPQEVGARGWQEMARRARSRHRIA
jgi:hypothetical protein